MARTKKKQKAVASDLEKPECNSSPLSNGLNWQNKEHRRAGIVFSPPGLCL